jgi:hypothetical protein
MNKENIISIVVLVVISIGVLALFALPVLMREPAEARNLDSFAQCLADKGVTMYGAVWCPACGSQKRIFGDSFGIVPYVECPDDPERCMAAGIRAYPTWVFPDGTRLEGKQDIETLSQRSGCEIPREEAQARL